jgi:DNA polymerase-3 subunit delta'
MSVHQGFTMGEQKSLEPYETNELFGHGLLERRLLELYRSGRQHHALLLAGPRGIGKATLAFRLASFVLVNTNPLSDEVASANSLHVDAELKTRRLVSRLAHPDLITINPNIFSEENKSGEIKVDHVRWALSRLATLPDSGGWRVCIIDTVDDLNNNAANALLKVLEEPPEKTIMILISSRPQRLLATIRSRCIKFSFGPIENDDTSKAILTACPELADDGNLPGLIKISQGSPGRAIQLARAQGLELHRKFKSLTADLMRLDMGEVHKLASDLGEAKASELYNIFLEFLENDISDRVIKIACRQHVPLALEPWLQLWEKVTMAINDTQTFNLDRKQLILNAFFELEENARKSTHA